MLGGIPVLAVVSQMLALVGRQGLELTANQLCATGAKGAGLLQQAGSGDKATAHRVHGHSEGAHTTSLAILSRKLG